MTAALQVSASAAQHRRVASDKKLASHVTKRGMVPAAAAEVSLGLRSAPGREAPSASRLRAWLAAA